MEIGSEPITGKRTRKTLYTEPWKNWSPGLMQFFLSPPPENRARNLNVRR